MRHRGKSVGYGETVNTGIPRQVCGIQLVGYIVRSRWDTVRSYSPWDVVVSLWDTLGIGGIPYGIEIRWVSAAAASAPRDKKIQSKKGHRLCFFQHWFRVLDDRLLGRVLVHVAHAGKHDLLIQVLVLKSEPNLCRSHHHCTSRIYIFFFKSSGRRVRIKLKLPHFHVRVGYVIFMGLYRITRAKEGPYAEPPPQGKNITNTRYP